MTNTRVLDEQVDGEDVAQCPGEEGGVSCEEGRRAERRRGN